MAEDERAIASAAAGERADEKEGNHHKSALPVTENLSRVRFVYCTFPWIACEGCTYEGRKFSENQALYKM